MIVTQSSIQSLDNIGWDKYWESLFLKYKGPYIPGRVCTVHKSRYEAIVPGGSLSLPVSGALKAKKQFPVVGDFVVILHQPELATDMIVAILPRKTSLSRGDAGESGGEQHLAANIDAAFIVTDPEKDLNIARIERYLLIVRSAKAEPVIVLNKADTCADITAVLDMIRTQTGDIPTVVVSAINKTGLDNLNPYLGRGKTIVLLGSSGVGKSTLINVLSGEELQKTSGIREDDGRGRHTTTVRHLIALPDGTSLIDTPGLREIRIWTAKESISKTFEDIHEYSKHCKFSDCTHNQEPGCAVRKAIEDGKLHAERLDRYHKILKEVAFEHDKATIGLKRSEKKRYKEISKTIKEIFDNGKRKS